MYWQQNSKPLKTVQQKDQHNIPSAGVKLPEASPFFHFINSFFLFAILFGVILLGDYFLPRKKIKEPILEWIATFDGQSYPKKYFLLRKLNNEIPIEFSIRTEHCKIPLSIDDAMVVDIGDTIEIYRTLLFQITSDIQTNEHIWIKPYFNFYTSLLFIPLFLIVFSLLGIYGKMKEDWIYTFVVLDFLLFLAFIVIRLFYF